VGSSAGRPGQKRRRVNKRRDNDVGRMGGYNHLTPAITIPARASRSKMYYIRLPDSHDEHQRRCPGTAQKMSVRAVAMIPTRTTTQIARPRRSFFTYGSLMARVRNGVDSERLRKTRRGSSSYWCEMRSRTAIVKGMKSYIGGTKSERRRRGRDGRYLRRIGRTSA
jgi:hypothetical protein